MPEYTFQCLQCNSEYTERRGINDYGSPATCACGGKAKRVFSSKRAYVNTESWIPGWYEHIDHDPIYIHDKKQLLYECEKRGVYSKAFAKSKSRGHGLEHAGTRAVI